MVTIKKMDHGNEQKKWNLVTIKKTDHGNDKGFGNAPIEIYSVLEEHVPLSTR